MCLYASIETKQRAEGKATSSGLTTSLVKCLLFIGIKKTLDLSVLIARPLPMLQLYILGRYLQSAQDQLFPKHEGIEYCHMRI